MSESTTEAKHTPGPWKSVRGVATTVAELAKHDCILDSSGIEIAEIYRRDNDDEQHANAQLIAAAPETAAQRDDLLAACRDLLDAFWDMSPLEYAKSRGMDSMSDAEGERIKERARAAIAAAKGADHA